MTETFIITALGISIAWVGSFYVTQWINNNITTVIWLILGFISILLLIWATPAIGAAIREALFPLVCR